ncbi:hypothetical protein QS306_15845 [Paraburkholderia bonniea]|uniref:hypothetical protein n=1 Tax=Paraburkholderia bonniea TaxID=2152891 RepID=UPI002573FAB1|nr:hypothetical protein [Paraburkholderia bonniea]WJF91560.1 hypothetical protein QS306_15845 [Paraburkholderia bonniea]WJF94880.1 hypothetical protein QS308_15850 [Paraburkholderia bonniea]
MTLSQYIKNIYISIWQVIKCMPIFLLTISVFFALTKFYEIGIGMQSASSSGIPYEPRKLTVKEGYWIIKIIHIYLGAMIGIKVSRLILIGEKRNSFIPEERKILLLYTGLILIYVALIFAAAIIIAKPVFMAYRYNLSSIQMFIVAAISTSAVFYFYIRLALLFPAISLGSGVKLATAWKAGSKNFLRFLLIFSVALIIFYFTQLLIFSYIEKFTLKLPALYILSIETLYKGISLTMFFVVAAACSSWICINHVRDFKK